MFSGQITVVEYVIIATLGTIGGLSLLFFAIFISRECIRLNNLVIFHIPYTQERELINLSILFMAIIYYLALVFAIITLLEVTATILTAKFKEFKFENNSFLETYASNLSQLRQCAANPTPKWLTTQAKKIFGIALTAEELHPSGIPLSRLVEHSLYEKQTTYIIGEFLDSPPPIS